MTALQLVWIGGVWCIGVRAHAGQLVLLFTYTIFCAVVVGYMPVSLIRMLRRFRIYAEQNTQLLGMFFGMVVLCLLLYAGAQAGWPDETKVLGASRVVAEQGGASFFARYAALPWLGNQHPPLVPLVYGYAMQLFGSDRIVARILSLLCGLGALLCTYGIGSLLYGRHIGVLAALFFISTTLFWRLGATALSDMPVTFFFSLATYLLLCLRHTPTVVLALAAGACLGAGLLSKYTMLFFYPVLCGYWLVDPLLRRRSWYLGIVSGVSGGILSAWVGYAYISGIWGPQQRRLSEFALFALRGNWQVIEWVLVRLPSDFGVYLLPLLGLGLWQLWRRRSPADVLILIWIAVVALPLLFTLPNPRYFLPVFPALVIATAVGLESVPEVMERVALLALLYCGGTMALFWEQAKPLFVLG